MKLNIGEKYNKKDKDKDKNEKTIQREGKENGSFMEAEKERMMVLPIHWPSNSSKDIICHEMYKFDQTFFSENLSIRTIFNL